MTIAGYEYALLNSATVPPFQYKVLWHGTDLLKPVDVKIGMGLPAKGTNLDLLAHVMQDTTHGVSAFRGTTYNRLTPDQGAGAALWGEWVYQIVDYPGYDLNAILCGRVGGALGFSGNPMSGEQEIAIPAEVPLGNIGFPMRTAVGERGKRLVEMDWSEV